MEFKEISDEQWEFIRPLLPSPAKEGRPRADDRRTINAILYVLTTGCRWMDLPERYGPKSTAHDRLKDWEKKVVWKSILDALISRKYTRGELSIQKVSIDSSDVAAKKGEMRLGTMATKR
jgi:transposase